jgi:hypothetical protein
MSVTPYRRVRANLVPPINMDDKHAPNKNDANNPRSKPASFQLPFAVCIDAVVVRPYSTPPTPN